MWLCSTVSIEEMRNHSLICSLLVAQVISEDEGGISDVMCCYLAYVSCVLISIICLLNVS